MSWPDSDGFSIACTRWAPPDPELVHACIPSCISIACMRNEPRPRRFYYIISNACKITWLHALINFRPAVHVQLKKTRATRDKLGEPCSALLSLYSVLDWDPAVNVIRALAGSRVVSLSQHRSPKAGKWASSGENCKWERVRYTSYCC